MTEHRAVSCLLWETRRGSARAAEGDEDQEEEEDSDTGRLPGTDQDLNNDLYSLEEISGFLDESFGKSVKVKDCFQDTGKFVCSAIILQKQVGFDALNKKKHYRLKKHVSTLKKTSAVLKKRRSSKQCHASQGGSYG